MGLDISAFSEIKLLEALTDDYEGDGAQVSPNHPDHLLRGDGLASGFYSFTDTTSFRAGSYSGYNEWRNTLAQFAGYPAVDCANEKPYPRHDVGAWKAIEGPFWELIHFSDCDGHIGPQTSRKLAADFAEWQEKADAYGTDRWRETYREFRAAFELAANNGVVIFH